MSESDDCGRKNVSADIIQHINSRNAKIAALFVVLGFIGYHGAIHLVYGIDTCKWLLSDGRFQGYHIWQPYGCMMHSYSEKDARMSMRYNAYWGGHTHLSFIGDSRIRQIYFAMIRHLGAPVTDDLIGPPITSTDSNSQSQKTTISKVGVNRHNNYSYSNDNLKLKTEFIWRPLVNNSMIAVFSRWVEMEQEKRPNLIVTGGATWHIRQFNGSETALENYKTNLVHLVALANRLSPGTRLLFTLQDPVVYEKLNSRRKVITNEQIDLYNKAALEILKDSAVEIWSSSRLVSQGYNNDCEDGLHMGKVALTFNTQLLLNLYNNDRMNYNDGTCCSSAEPFTTLQIMTFAMFSVFCLLAIAMIAHRWVMNNTRGRGRYNRFVSGENSGSDLSNVYLPAQNSEGKNNFEFVTNMAKLGLIMAFFLLSDRTNFFMKENKYFTYLNFFLPLAYVFALGLFFTEESTHTKVLHIDQTDEWKGWMQLVILIYHMTGASQILPIYMHVRVLVTSYLFLTGYGHFMYFWHTGDYSVVRLFRVLFRYNILVVSLCLSMNRHYQFYYFMPLVSFWFVMVYLTLSIVPRVTQTSADSNNVQYLYIILKFVALATVVSVLFASEVFFERLFLMRPWKALFVNADDSIRDWWFRWKIDRYSVVSGMGFAFLYQTLRTNRILDDSNHGNLFSGSLGLLVACGSFLGITGYSAFAYLCRNKAEGNEVHPYAAFIPIICYAILRNMSGLLRTRYSPFFAFFGRISLELFICQYHIWLAADTHGILVLVPSYPVLNVIVTSFIFVCISHEIHGITRVLCKYFIPSDWKKALRNVIIFAITLVPIGIHDGMF